MPPVKKSTTHRFTHILAVLTLFIITNLQAQEPESNPIELTLLQELNGIHTTLDDSSGFIESDIIALIEPFLATDEPYIDFASSSQPVVSGYAGVKLSTVNGEAIYVAVNTNDTAATVSYPDAYTVQVPPYGIAVRFQGFSDTFIVSEFNDQFFLNGNDFTITAPSVALSMPLIANGKYYQFYDGYVVIENEDIVVAGATEIVGTEYNDTFDFSRVENAITITVDGNEGVDTIIGKNAINNWSLIDGSGSISSQESRISFYNADNLIGGENDDAFILESNAIHIGSISGEHLTIISNNTENPEQTSSPYSSTLSANSSLTLSTNGSLSSSELVVGQTEFIEYTASIHPIEIGYITVNDTTETIEFNTEFKAEANSEKSDSGGGGSIDLATLLMILGASILRRKNKKMG
ncbi:MAG: hypothetical protein K6L76_00530 [Agarilytica sp.]